MVPPLTIIKVFAEVPFTVKSLASRVPGSTARVRLTEKSVGGVKTVIPQSGLLTEQPAEVGVGVAVVVVVGVAVAVAVGVAVGVGLSQKISMLSILQPSPGTPLESLPIRHRSMITCPAGRATLVVIKPPEFPVHASRPAIGLQKSVEIDPL